MMFHLQVRTLKHNSPTVLAGQEDTHPQGMPHQTQLLGSLVEEWNVSGMLVQQLTKSEQRIYHWMSPHCKICQWREISLFVTW